MLVSSASLMQLQIITLLLFTKRLNVCNQNEWENVWDFAEKYFGEKVQILVNNAEVKGAIGWKYCLEINLYGLMIGSFLARDRMGKTKVIDTLDKFNSNLKFSRFCTKNKDIS